jgi:gluconolactonase
VPGQLEADGTLVDGAGKRSLEMRYDVTADGTLGRRQVFVDMTSAPGEDAIDGVKVDERGNVYVPGPGGVWILSPEGRHLGTVEGHEHPHNFTWGDAGTLYVTARTSLYRLRLSVAGSWYNQ